MTTRAANIQFLISGLKNPVTGRSIAGGSVYFYAAGTSNQKYIYTEKEKSNGYYSYTLGEAGEVENLFGEGEYDIVVKDSGGTTLTTLYGIRLEHPYYGVTSVTSTPYTQLSQIDLLLVDTTVGDITINCIAAASWTRSLKVFHILGSNDVIINPSGSETIDGELTLTFRNAVVEIASDGSNLRSVGFRSAVADSDNDTKIQVEETSDEDVIRFDAGGNEIMKIYASGPHTVYVSGGLSVTSGGLSVTGGASLAGVSADDASVESLEIDSILQPYILPVPIGAWNVDTTANVNISSGVSYVNVINATAVIMRDDGLRRFPISYAGTAGTSTLEGPAASIHLEDDSGTARAVIYRRDGHDFDNANYSSVLINRGYVFFHVVPAFSTEYGDGL